MACPGGRLLTPWPWVCPWGRSSGGWAVHGRLLYGAPADLPWAVTFTNPDSLCPVREPLHPSQLYEALLLLGVFGFLYWFGTRKRFDGQVILTYFCLAGLVRFVVEFFWSPLDYRGPYFSADALTQLVALGLFQVCGGLLLYWSFRPRRAQEQS